MAPDTEPPGGADLRAALEALRAENDALLRRMAEGERRFRLIARRILRVQEAERARVSRELHDGLGQSLTALHLHVELARREEEGRDTRLAEAAALAADALAAVRRIAHLLRPQMLDQLGLYPTLRWLARTFAETAGLHVEMEHDTDERRLDPEVETLAFRVVQEALSNAARHSGARSASVRVGVQGDRLRVRVRDEGRGFDPRTTVAADGDGGFGLNGMRERVRLVGGGLRIDAAPGRGTTVEADIPLNAGAEARP